MWIKLTRQQVTLIFWAMITGGSPVAAILMKRADITPNEWDDWVTLASVIVSIVSGSQLSGMGSLKAMAQAAREMSPMDQQTMADGLAPGTKIRAVEDLPAVRIIAVASQGHPELATIADDPAHPKVVDVTAGLDPVPKRD